MFANIIFLVLALLIVNLGLDIQLVDISPGNAFIYGILLYVAFLSVVYIQEKVVRKDKYTVKIAQYGLVIFLLIYNFVFYSQRIYLLFPEFLRWELFSEIISLAMYFGGIWWAHYISSAPKVRYQYANAEVRFLFPFIVPFLVFEIIIDVLQYFLPQEFMLTPLFFVMLIALLLLFLGAMLSVMPYFIQRLWGCSDMPPSLMLTRLETLCRRTNFKHSGIKIWTVMQTSLTAGVIGIIAKFRYVMFSPRLLHILSEEETEAVLAHEIGHSYYKHLWFYPFLVLGMPLITALFFQFFGSAIVDYIVLTGAVARYIFAFVLFLPCAAVVVLYFRYVFGLFSRCFERQADLYVFKIGIQPQYLMSALDKAAIAMGGVHQRPNWHHYSISQRIDCLKYAMEDPRIVDRQDRKIRKMIIVYLIIFLMLTIILLSTIS